MIAGTSGHCPKRYVSTSPNKLTGNHRARERERGEFLSNQAVEEVFPVSLGQWRIGPLSLFLLCFDTLIFTICTVSPFRAAFHLCSVVWVNSVPSCCF